MDPRISFVTLAVADLATSRAFYVDGLGWEPAYADDEVVMIQAGEHLMLSLWDRAAFEAEVGPIAVGEGVAPFTLAHNVADARDVDVVLETARAVGASHVALAVEREWGGYFEKESRHRGSGTHPHRGIGIRARCPTDETTVPQAVCSARNARLAIGTTCPGFFGDPDGHRWEIAYNPGPIGERVLP